jgi:hypothetical protein
MLPYKEGTVFLVPLRGGGFARGVVARVAKSEILLGYFFGPRLSSSSSVDVSGLDPSRPDLRVRFGDLGLIDGEWRTCGEIGAWDRREWPMPEFVRKDPFGKKGDILVRYSDNDPARIETEHAVSDATGLEPDAVLGYGAVEIKLSKLLGK